MVYQRELDATFAALADPTRRAILSRLAAGDRTISELAAGFAMTLPAVSKHVRVLERAGLARIRREGRARRTALTARPMRNAMQWIERYRRFWEFQFDQLAAYLDTTSTLETPAWPPQPRAKQKRSKSAASSKRRNAASSRRGRAPTISNNGRRRDR